MSQSKIIDRQPLPIGA